jgi:hypothetical protein
MSELMEVVFKNSSGGSQAIRCLEIVSVDGVPFNNPHTQEAEMEELRQAINFLSGEINTIKDLMRREQ